MLERFKNVTICADQHNYDARIGIGGLNLVGADLRRIVGDSTDRVFIVSNETVFPIYGATVAKSLETVGFSVNSAILADGEEYKNFDSLEQIISELSKARMDRNSVVIALGGGVVGDIAGFAAAIFLRGIRYYQIPTTLLAMIDSSVGGKTGINTPFGKNLCGAFHSPIGVLADIETLETLDPRELTAGQFELIKHALIGDVGLLKETRDYLKNRRSEQQLIELIKKNIEFKASIVENDREEDRERTDSRARKILNFGHTVAHSLERETQYLQMRHGEAVGYGMLVAGTISSKLELLDADSLELLRDAIGLVGLLRPVCNKLSANQLIEAFEADKKVTNGELQWVLLKGIGKPIIVENSKIPVSVIREAIIENIFNKHPKKI